jgi:tRNA(Ile2) C34 agmatinyltransferase TiaS
MKVFISIDDTDSIDSRGTGEIANLLAEGIRSNGWGRCGAVTRHQLLLHPDIPYTSHNSSMCFPAEISADKLETVICYCCSTLPAESVAGSDPGLCIMVPERLENPEIVVEFGRKAKKAVITKEEAYATASHQNVHLSEHGGTGQGVIGALAGAGLRFTGNDGIFQGKFRVPAKNGIARVKEICGPGIDCVQTLQGQQLHDEEPVYVGEWVKPVLLGEKAVVLAVPAEGMPGISWKACDRKVFMKY